MGSLETKIAVVIVVTVRNNFRESFMSSVLASNTGLIRAAAAPASVTQSGSRKAGR
jgi:hypothetical protein